MGLHIVTGPALEPVSLAEAKVQCDIFIDDDDSKIVGYLIAARQHLEAVTRRAFMTQTIDYTIDAWHEDAWLFNCFSAFTRFGYSIRRENLRPYIQIPRPPLASVTSISYVDINGNTQTLASDQYLASTYAYVGRIAPAYGVVWPGIRPQLDAVTIRYQAGYGSNPADVPEAIRQAILLLVCHWYENQSASTQSASKELPLGVDALIYPHRILDLG